MCLQFEGGAMTELNMPLVGRVERAAQHNSFFNYWVELVIFAAN